jgi:hypothetical protein
MGKSLLPYTASEAKYVISNSIQYDGFYMNIV